MIHEIKFRREIRDLGCDDVPDQRIEMTVDGSVTLPELVRQFECFVKACGYYPPDGQHLDFVEEE